MAKKTKSCQPEKIRLMFWCHRCGHKWKGRKDRPPVKCPGCDSVLWATPRRTKGAYRGTGMHNKLKALQKKLGRIPAMAGVKEDGES